MAKYSTVLRSGAVVGLAALALAACGGGSGGGTSKKSGELTGGLTGVTGGYGGGKVPMNPSTAKGGTLNIGETSDFDYLDPARTYYAFSLDFHNLTNRTLLTYAVNPDPVEGTKLVSDIAEGPATGQNNNTVWTYKLKKGIKYQDGTEITSKDVKYAIERTFATDVINGGPTYFKTLLDDKNNSYPGPYKDKDPNHLGLKAIATPDDQTITFTLNRPFSEWNFVMTLPGVSPVPQKVDLNPKTGGANYNTHVVSTGPYQIASYKPAKSLDLVRNPAYDPSTDGTRAALPDKIHMVTNFDPDTLDKSIAEGSIDVDAGGTGVQQTMQTKILGDAALKARALNPITGFTRYLSIFTKVITNVHCRRALEYGVNKSNQVRARGGSVGGGAPATTQAPPSLLGYEKYDLYPSTNRADAVAKAKDELKQCGKPSGFSTILVTTNKGKAIAQSQFIQSDLKEIGVKVTIKQFDSATYYSSVVGVPANVHKNKYGIAVAGWGPDWPAPYGYYENIVDPRAILPQGNSNYAECDNPLLVTEFDAALSAKNQTEANSHWNKVDRIVLGDACTIPVVYDKALDLFSARLKNVMMQPAFGIVDFRTLGVA